MNRKTFWYGQLVDQVHHLNPFGDYMEAAERAMHSDNLPSGVASGLAVAQQVSPDLTVVVDSGVARDATGQRIYVPSPQTVSLALDSLGSTTAVTTVGNSRIISVYAKFKRNNQTPYTDLNSATGYEDNLESFEFVVRVGTEGTSPTAPALDNSMVLLADITRAYGATTITTADIDLTTRRQDAYAVTGTTYTSPVALRRGRVIDALRDLLGKHNGHVAGSIDKHAAGDITVPTITGAVTTIASGTLLACLQALQTAAKIDKTISPAFADTTTLAAASLSTWLDALVTKLAGTGGAGAVGNAAHGNFSAGSVATQLAELDKTTTNDDGAKRVATEAKGMLPGGTVRADLDALDGRVPRVGAAASYAYTTRGGTIQTVTGIASWTNSSIVTTAINGLKTGDLVIVTASFGVDGTGSGAFSFRLAGGTGAGSMAAIGGSEIDWEASKQTSIQGVYTVPADGNYIFAVQYQNPSGSGASTTLLGSASIIARPTR